MLPYFNSLKRSPYFDRYLSYLTSDDLPLVMNQSAEEFISILQSFDDDKWSYRYGEGKWTVEQVALHTIETELIFNYRALRMARETQSQSIDGFDENVYAKAMKVGAMTPAEIMDYFLAVRTSAKGLLNTLTEDQLSKVGIASGQEIEVRATFYIMAGHTLHHAQILKERYC